MHNWKIALAIFTIAIFYSESGYSSTRCDLCQRDKEGHIQRHFSAKTKFMRGHPCPSTGLIKGKCPGYVIDHIIALKRGGSDSPDNMQWQTTADAKAKDKWE